MLSFEIYFILIAIFIVAFLYSSVGHGGASGYLALMVLIGASPVLMKPSALLLNIGVAGIATFQFTRAGYFNWKLLVPFIILSIPMAFIGAKYKIDEHIYKVILGICLVIASVRLVAFPKNKSALQIKPLNIPLALVIGAIIGFISGMIGIGGGILLSPLLLFLNWADLRTTAATSAPFILVNSISGFAGVLQTGAEILPDFYIWVIAALGGGLIGSYYGSFKLNKQVLRVFLSLVLLFASSKLFFSF